MAETRARRRSLAVQASGDVTPLTGRPNGPNWLTGARNPAQTDQNDPMKPRRAKLMRAPFRGRLVHHLQANRLSDPGM
jgi:hypothetical protein